MDAVRLCRNQKQSFTNTHEFLPSFLSSLRAEELPQPAAASPPPTAASPTPEYPYIDEELLQETLDYADQVFAALEIGDTEDSDVEHRYLRDHQVKLDLQYSTFQINESLQADAELFLSHQKVPYYPFPSMYLSTTLFVAYSV